MKEINQKENWRNYNTSKEFSKDIKFNKKWYHLTALFDKDQDGEDFDFNDVPEPQEFDFNDNIDLTPIYEPDQYLNSVEFDFNSVLMEKYKITEIGLIMGQLNEANQKTISNIDLSEIAKHITTNNEFLNFYNNINSFNMGNGFYIKTALEIYTNNNGEDEMLASINDETKFKDDRSYTATQILQTILKSAGGYANEATIQLLSGIKHNKKDPTNIIQLLSDINVCNNNNPMAFPDAVFNKNENDIIPIDLKVAYGNSFSAASSSNARMMTGIHNALLKIVHSNKTFIDFIKDTKLTYKNNKINESEILPELKAFLLISSTQYENGRLNYNNICIKPLIACMHGRSTMLENGISIDPLFATKSRRATGAISYDNGSSEIYNVKDSILNGCPKRFAEVIYNFYKCLVENYNEKAKDKYDHLLTFLPDEIRHNKDQYEQMFKDIFAEIDPNFKEKIKNDSLK